MQTPIATRSTIFFLVLMNDVWYQQNSESFHTSHFTTDLLHQTFDILLISRHDDVSWSLRSCDLTHLEHFPWRAIKDNCYAAKIETIEHLKVNICDVFAKLRSLHSWSYRRRHSGSIRGCPVNKIIFHLKPKQLYFTTRTKYKTKFETIFKLQHFKWSTLYNRIEVEA